LPFALLAAAMAWSANARATPPVPFRWWDLLGILVCMATARSAAMAFNRLADRQLDALNPRTQMRHLPMGLLSTGSVISFTVACSLGFVAGTLLFLPRNAIPLCASLPVLAFLFGYSYAKRFTALSHFWLGAALMLAPVAAWVAIRAEVAWPPIVLGVAVLLWVAGFDIIYACQDVEFDEKMWLRSVPVPWWACCCCCRKCTMVWTGFFWAEWRPSACCWSTSIGSSGPTILAASTARSSTSTPW
jgi:4-hydroxybenzoate polyprenyltransferase